MKNVTAPMFRKAMNGYNKDDVNAYIMSLSRQLKESEAVIAKLTQLNNAASDRIDEMEPEYANIPIYTDRIAQLESAVARLTAEIEELNKANAVLEARASDAEASAAAAGEKYDQVCRNAGQILALAGNTADDILRRAGDEAHKLIDDANSAKSAVFSSISATTKDFTSDIGAYINNAIENCIKKINDNISTFEKGAPVQSDRVVFINDN